MSFTINDVEIVDVNIDYLLSNLTAEHRNNLIDSWQKIKENLMLQCKKPEIVCKGCEYVEMEKYCNAGDHCIRQAEDLYSNGKEKKK